MSVAIQINSTHSINQKSLIHLHCIISTNIQLEKFNVRYLAFGELINDP
jgi:hypothetical protein